MSISQDHHMNDDEWLPVPKVDSGQLGELAQGVPGPQITFDWDGWYVVEGGDWRSATCAEVIDRAGPFSRGYVLRETRQYIAKVGEGLAKGAWISPIASKQNPGVDPKLPAEEIERAGHVLAKLGCELRDLS